MPTPSTPPRGGDDGFYRPPVLNILAASVLVPLQAYGGNQRITLLDPQTGGEFVVSLTGAPLFAMVSMSGMASSAGVSTLTMVLEAQDPPKKNIDLGSNNGGPATSLPFNGSNVTASQHLTYPTVFRLGQGRSTDPSLGKIQAGRYKLGIFTDVRTKVDDNDTFNILFAELT